MDGWITYYLEECGVQPDSTHHLLVQAIAPELCNPKLSVQQLAEMFDISRRQLYRDIHTLLNKPVGQWIRELRLYKAKWLIQKKQVITLEELVEQVGFKSTDYFRRIYRDFFDTDLSAHFSHPANQLTKKINDVRT